MGTTARQPGQPRGVRLAAEDARQLAIRSQAEATAATDAETAERHTRMAASAEALQPAYRRIEARLEEAMDDRRAWEQITAWAAVWPSRPTPNSAAVTRTA